MLLSDSCGRPHEFPWNPLAALGDLPLYEIVLRAWATPGRAYHDQVHLRAMLRRCGEAAAEPGFEKPAEIFLATLFHDAIYEPLAQDNEARSAVFARESIAAEPHLAAIDVGTVTALIEATAHHASFEPRDADDDQALFLDADMAILGAPPDVYDAYTHGVRAEYSAVPDDAFRSGRCRFLRGVLAAPAIFLSPYFRGRLEAAARANVQRELATLEAG